MTPNRTLALAKPKPKTNWFEFCLVLLGRIGIQIEKKKMSMVEPNLEGFLNQKKQVKNHYFPLVSPRISPCTKIFYLEALLFYLLVSAEFYAWKLMAL